MTSVVGPSISPFFKLHDGIFEVLATNGDTHLGGDDIDNLLIRIALEDITSEWGEDMSGNQEAVQLLRRAVIRAKEELSFVPHGFHRSGVSRENLSPRTPAGCFRPPDRACRRPHLGPCRQCLRDAESQWKISPKSCWSADPLASLWSATRSKHCSARVPTPN